MTKFKHQVFRETTKSELRNLAFHEANGNSLFNFEMWKHGQPVVFVWGSVDFSIRNSCEIFHQFRATLGRGDTRVQDLSFHTRLTWASTLAKPVLSSCNPSFQRCCCRSRSTFIRTTTWKVRQNSLQEVTEPWENNDFSVENLTAPKPKIRYLRLQRDAAYLPIAREWHRSPQGAHSERPSASNY